MVQMPESAKRKFGKLVKEWRARNGKTQQDLALLLDSSVSIVRKWESGERFPAFRLLKLRIKDVMGIDIDAFVANELQEGGERTSQG